MAGRHLSRRDKTKGGGGIVSPLVEVEVVGMPCDSKSYRTRAISSNGLCPVWNEMYEFTVHYPEAALLRLAVEDGDFLGPQSDPFVGYRSVPLKNEYSEELELSSLLVHISYEPPGTDFRPSNFLTPGGDPETARSLIRKSPRIIPSVIPVNESNLPPLSSVPNSPLPFTPVRKKTGSNKLKQLLRFSSSKKD